MNDLGMPPGWHPDPSQEPPRSARSSDVPVWAIAVAVVLMLALAGTVLVMVRQANRAEAKPSYPTAWDPRVAPYAAIAEHRRGLFFKHPVAVEFQAPATFEKSVRVDKSKLSAHDKQDMDHFAGLMRAFGLVSGDVDLLTAFDDASGSGTLAYYSFEDQKIYIRGQRVTPSVRPTLVHELTHALQDQYFDIGAREQKLDKHDVDSASSVFDSMVEGDAERVEDDYQASLSARQRRVVARSEKADRADADKQLAKVPKVVLTIIGAPYVLGEGLMQTVAAEGGNQAVDELFRKPPTHETVLLDPLRALVHDTGARTVPVPKLAPGEKKFESGELGSLTWYLMLAQRLPLKQALAAVDGWGGDAYVGFERDGTSCARIDYEGETTADSERMVGALRRWVAAPPGTPADVSTSGSTVQLESCDPGKAVLVRRDHSQEAMELAATRSYVEVGLLRAHVPAHRAQCIAHREAQSFTTAQLQAPGKHPGVLTSMRRVAATCR